MAPRLASLKALPCDIARFRPFQTRRAKQRAQRRGDLLARPASGAAARRTVTRASEAGELRLDARRAWLLSGRSTPRSIVTGAPVIARPAGPSRKATVSATSYGSLSRFHRVRRQDDLLEHLLLLQAMTARLGGDLRLDKRSPDKPGQTAVAVMHSGHSCQINTEIWL
jgi:hypothetical protein